LYQIRAFVTLVQVSGTRYMSECHPTNQQNDYVFVGLVTILTVNFWKKLMIN